MADDKKKPKRGIISTLLIFALIAGLLLWLALVLTTQGEERLEQACKPVEYSTQFLHDATTAIIGRQPTWTLYVQRYLMTGCYYSFSVILSQGTQGETVGGGIGGDEPTAPTGGIKP